MLEPSQAVYTGTSAQIYFVGIIGENPSVSKSNRLHVVIVWVSFIELGCILMIHVDWSLTFPKLLNFDQLFTETQPVIRR